jgi:hypothetical protein
MTTETNKIIGKYNWKDCIPDYIKLEELTKEQRYKLMGSEYFKCYQQYDQRRGKHFRSTFTELKSCYDSL